MSEQRERPATIEEALKREDEWPNWPVLPVVDRARTKSGVVLPRLTQNELHPGPRAVVFVCNMFAQPLTELFLRSCSTEEFDSWDDAHRAGWRAD